MPIYEFRCESCGAQFEALVDVGTEHAECRVCGTPGAVRLLSAPAAPMSLVKSPGDRRRQERKNAQLHQSTKANFKAKRQRARRRTEGKG